MKHRVYKIKEGFEGNWDEAIYTDSDMQGVE